MGSYYDKAFAAIEKDLQARGETLVSGKPNLFFLWF